MLRGMACSVTEEKMVKKLTLKQVLKKAIRREIESQNLYTDLSQKVADKVAKDTFRELTLQERGHQNRLEQYLQGELKGALSMGQVIDFKIAERFDQPVISAGMMLKDTFLLAANREKASHEFYTGLAEIHPAGEVKSLLKQLASQELEHKKRVEFLFAEVAFPQTDGG